MARLLSTALVALSVIVSCGKTPLADDAKAEPPDLGGVNVCDAACVPRADTARAKHAVRSRPAPRVVSGGAPGIRVSTDEMRTVAKPASKVRDRVTSAGFLYWTERGEARLECRPDGSMPSCSGGDLRLRHPSGALRRTRIADGRVEVLAAELDDVDGILVVNELVYVSTAQGLLRVPSSGGTATMLPTDEPASGRPALDPVSWTVYVHTRDKLLAVEP